MQLSRSHGCILRLQENQYASSVWATVLPENMPIDSIAGTAGLQTIAAEPAATAKLRKLVTASIGSVARDII